MERKVLKKCGIGVVVFLIMSSSLLSYILNKGQEPVVYKSPYFNPEKKFLVHSSKCKIPNLDPWNSDARRFYVKKNFVRCSDVKPLTYVVTDDNVATLRIDAAVESSCYKSGVKCCYINVTRSEGPDPDNDISVSSCKDFEIETQFNSNAVLVRCFDGYSNRQIYENAHTAMPLTKDIHRRLNASSMKRTKPPSVIFVGIDSISRLNFYRMFPLMHNYLMQNEWLEYQGYNKIGDNTFPNLMGFLTGRNLQSAMKKCDPKETGKLDGCNFIWKDFQKLGYITAYAEDEVSISTFNYNKKGFHKPPTDYYFRPYMLAAERLNVRKIDGMTYCTGPLTSAERILNLAKEFIGKFGNHPKFGFFWMNSFSHDDINDPGRMDGVFVKFFEEIHEKMTANTIVIFLSDHGMRFGDIRLTGTGWLEERLPFLYFWLPQSFKTNFPGEFRNLKANGQKLTTPYDLYLTLQDILLKSGFNYTLKSEACPRCKSLFTVIDERSCEEAGIDMHWCTCTGYKYFNPKSVLALEASSFAIDVMNKMLDENSETAMKCVHFKVNTIISSSISDGRDSQNKTYLLLMFSTHPASVLEVTVSLVYENGTEMFKIEGSFSRLDQYKFTSQCVLYADIFCYCRWNLFFHLNFFSFWFEI